MNVEMLLHFLKAPGKYFWAENMASLQVCWPVCPLAELLTFDLFAQPTCDPSAPPQSAPGLVGRARSRAPRPSIRISARAFISHRVHRRMDSVTFG